MKKARTIFTAALLCMIFAVAAGCSISQASNITLISYPKTEYLLDEKIDNLEFTIEVTIENTVRPVTFSVNDPNGVRVENFSTEKVGSFTAYFTYRSFTYRFDYTVTDGTISDFAGGSGSEADPYLIANAEQFKNIVLKGNDSRYTYYELTADIDLSGLDVSADSAYREKIEIGQFKYPTESEYSFNGSLDGNGHKLMNFKATTDLGIFGTIKNGDFSNIVIDGFNTVGYRVGAFGNGPYSTAAITDTANAARASFTDVTINENCRLGFAGFIFQAKGASEVTFKNCVMNGAVYGDGDNVGGFLGDVQSPTSFENCTMGGTVVGFNHVGAFVGWLGDGAEGKVVTDKGGNQLTGEAKCLAGNVSDYGEIMENGQATGTYEEGHFNTTQVVTGTLTVSQGTDSITWNAVDGAAYYRVVYNGLLFHFLKTGENTYNLHFIGGYWTPMEVSEKIVKPGETKLTAEILYTAFATSGGIDTSTKLSDKNGKLDNTDKVTLFNNTFGTNATFGQEFGPATVGTLASWVNGGDTTKTWLVVPAADLSTATSLILAKSSEITIRVFAYDAEGIIIAGGEIKVKAS